MKKRILGLLAMPLAIVLTVAGCGAGGGDTAAQTAADFVGTWAVDGVTSSDGDMSGEDLDLYKALGLYLTLDEGGTATFEMFGVELEGTWESTGAGTAMLTFEDDDADEAGVPTQQEITVADGKLTMKEGDDSITFAKIDPSEKQSGDIGSLLGDALDDIDLDDVDLTDTDDSSPLTDVRALDITVADDDICTITVTQAGDYYGDPGYLVRVANKTDDDIVVDDDNEFDVDGTQVSPVFSMEVDAGETDDEILWFENSEIGGGGVDALTGVTGKLVVSDDSGNVLATYDFAA